MLNIKLQEIENVAVDLNTLILAYKEAIDLFSFKINKLFALINDGEENISGKISKLLVIENKLKENILKMENLKLSPIDGVNYDEHINKCKELINNVKSNLDQITRMKHYIGEVKAEFMTVLQSINIKANEIGLIFENTYKKIRKIIDENSEDIFIDKEATFRLLEQLNKSLEILNVVENSIEIDINPIILQDKKINFYINKFKEELNFCFKELLVINEEAKKISIFEDEKIELLSKII